MESQIMPFVKAKHQPLKFIPKADLEKAQEVAAANHQAEADRAAKRPLREVAKDKPNA